MHAQLAALVTEAEQRQRVVAELRASIGALREQWRDRSGRRRAQVVEDEDKNLLRNRKGIEARAIEVSDTARAIALRAVELQAPGFLALDPASPEWLVPELPAQRLGCAVRIGSFDSEGVPALVPLLNVSGWSVDTPLAEFGPFAQLVAMRLLYALGPAGVNLTVYDPSLKVEMGSLAEIKRVAPSSIRPTVWNSEDLEPVLDDLVDHVRSVVDELAAEGFDNYLDGFIGTGRLAKPLQILVLTSTEDLSEKASKRLAQLVSVGRGRGVAVISRTTGPMLDSGMVEIKLNGRRSTTSAVPGVGFSQDPVPEAERLLRLAEHLAKVPKASTAPIVHFPEINDPLLEEGWIDPGDEGIEATIGLVGRHPLTVRLRSANPPMPNALIGGAVGQGKSNLLLVLIHSLASKYAPTDLEMVLLDFKDGVEFARLGPDARGRNGLPHLRAMGLEFDVDFGLAALEWVTDQLRARGDAFRETGATSLTEFREKGNSLPRILVVVDEFQRLFEGDDDTVDRAARLLESIARTGRSYGVHLVLSSQTITGIRGLAARSDAIFSQFHNRISLKNTPSESAAILSTGNRAAADLRERGEVVTNDSLGEVGANVKGVAAYADEKYLQRIRQQMWSQGDTGRPCRVFRARSLAELPPRYVAAPGEMVLGSPISVTESVRTITLRRAVSQAVAAVGPDAGLASLVIAAAVRSLPNLRKVVLFDGAGIDPVGYPVMTALLDQLRAGGTTIETVSRAEAPSRLGQLADEVQSDDESVPDLVLFFGMDSMVNLEEPDPATFIQPTDKLQLFLELAGQRQVTVLGWWQSVAKLRKHVGFEYRGIRANVLCGASRGDVQDICGAMVKPPISDQRVLFMDRGAGSRVELLVPFAAPGGRR
ncbi:FtsK/SpoIIIE domain-containing protein [Gordonia iterans]